MSKPSQPPKPTYDIPRLERRAPETHKGQVGRIAIIAGSRGMSGAAVLSGLGALRGGAGLVRVYTPESVWPAVAASEACFMPAPLPEDAQGRIGLSDASRLLDDLRDWDVLAIGPGLGRSSALDKLIGVVYAGFRGPLVVDADGLNSLAAGDPSVWQSRGGRPVVITPHPGEMSRVLSGLQLPLDVAPDDEHRQAAAHAVARSIQGTVVLKGHRSVVAEPEWTFINTTGNPGMASGGMGDVLTGLIAALLGQGLDAFDAARLGVYVHGLAADRAAERIGPVGYLARDVCDFIPAALAAAATCQVGFHNR